MFIAWSTDETVPAAQEPFLSSTVTGSLRSFIRKVTSFMAAREEGGGWGGETSRKGEGKRGRKAIRKSYRMDTPARTRKTTRAAAPAPRQPTREGQAEGLNNSH